MRKLSVLFAAAALSLLFVSSVIPAFTDDGEKDPVYGENQMIMTMAEYLEQSENEWFLTGKKEYTVQAMMPSKETSFHNELEVVDYAVTNDGITVILKGTLGEMWTSKLPKVISTYTKADGSEITEKDFEVKDRYIDLKTKAAPDTNYAMYVPNDISVTVETAWGDVLHTNLPNAPHGDGDFLVCRAGEDGEPDLSDVWVLNGALFPENYETENMKEAGKQAS